MKKVERMSGDFNHSHRAVGISNPADTELGTMWSIWEGTCVLCVLFHTIKCVTWIGCSNAGGSVANEPNASRFQRVDRGDPTVTQIHFKHLALGKLRDRRRLRREPTLCHYAGRVRRTMWTCWGRSPRFALVDMQACDGETDRDEIKVISSVVTFEVLRTLMDLWQAANLEGEIHNKNLKLH